MEIQYFLKVLLEMQYFFEGFVGNAIFFEVFLLEMQYVFEGFVGNAAVTLSL